MSGIVDEAQWRDSGRPTPAFHLLIGEAYAPAICLFQANLRRAGLNAEVTPASRADALIARLHCPSRFSALVVHLGLPGGEGTSLIRRIRTHPAAARTPLLVYTSEQDPLLARTALEAGADLVLPRAVTYSALAEALEVLLVAPRPDAEGGAAALRSFLAPFGGMVRRP